MARIIGNRIAVTSAVLVIGIAIAVTLKPSAAVAANGDPFILGSGNSASETTSLQVANNEVGVQIFDSGSSANAIQGWSQDGVGVFGKSDSGSTSDYLSWAGDGVHGEGTLNGVSGLTKSNVASGVYGQNDGTGFGVAGRATNGIGVLADSQNGTALSVQGRLVSSRSGVATISAGKMSVVVTLPNLTSASFVVATVQGKPAGTWVASAKVKPTNTFTIYLNKASTAMVTVGWFVIN